MGYLEYNLLLGLGSRSFLSWDFYLKGSKHLVMIFCILSHRCSDFPMISASGMVFVIRIFF